MWMEYFPNAVVYAIDSRILYEVFVRNKRTGRRLEMVSGWDERDVDRLVVFEGDQSSDEDLNEFCSQYGGEFDIIIDDGSHMQNDIINTFEFLFNKVKPGGIYIVEDMHTSYWKSFQGGYKGKNTSVEYFKTLIDYINFYHIRDDFNVVKIQKHLLNQEYIDKYAPWIKSITFLDGVVVIKKNKKNKLAPYKRIVVGKKQPVVPSIDIAKDAGYYVSK